MPYASLGPIAVHLPERIETNAELQALYPDWNMGHIFSKTGIAERRIADENECSSDLGVAAAEQLFDEHNIDPSEIDFLLFCTQTPDYPLPTTACLVQQRLGLRTSVGALDFNLGCSGYIYGLAMADGLIQAGSAEKVLLITAETYSKFIDPADRSLRTIFGDGAAATLVEASEQRSLSGFQFGTDGSGGDMLLVREGGCRASDDAIKPRNRHRWDSRLYMDGPSLVSFALNSLPGLIEDVLAAAEMERDQIELFLMHQATLKMLESVRQRLKLEPEELPIELKDCGNTVSSTLPILIDDLRRSGRLRPGKQTLLTGFGVGLSWGGCTWEETWSAEGYGTTEAEDEHPQTLPMRRAA